MAEMSVFDLPFLLAEFPGRPSMVVGDVETFHAEFRSFPMLFLRSSITRVGTAYAKVNFSLSLYFGTKEPFFCTFLQKALSPFLKECAKFFVNYFGRENPSVHRRGKRT
ncbi:hypothetical protein P4575_27450, partial [Priestia megaterium]|uniref:hypothetical protein n=1 Tax=Priestia megaterium TaxID=1404 RepID=UPI002E21F314|nr:hypothetical protein [Priestia megaterium]